MDLSALMMPAVVAAFAACLVALAVCDLRSYTIPNALCAAIAWLFVVAVPFARVEISLLSHLYSFLIVLAAGFLAFRFGLFGGGDIKSWAALALWYDLGSLSTQVFYVSLLGGMMGLLLVALRRVAASGYVQNHVALSRMPRLFRPGEPVPYGVAIAAGTAVSAPHIDLFRSFFS
jgi:prepilin peptidase CpaA